MFPPETLSRIVVEARMMGCSVITNELVGATSEEWFKLKGEELIDLMVEKRETIASILEDLVNSTEDINGPIVSVITSFHEGENYLEHFMDNMVSQTMFDKCELILIDAGVTSGAVRRQTDRVRCRRCDEADTASGRLSSSRCRGQV